MVEKGQPWSFAGKTRAGFLFYRKCSFFRDCCCLCCASRSVPRILSTLAHSARSIKMKENSILFRIQEAEERRLRLYEDYKAEILDEDEDSQLKEHYIAEKSYNDYSAGHQMNLFEDFIGYQGSAVLDEPEQKTDAISVPILQCEEPENIPLPDLPEQPENVQRPGSEVFEKGMLT